jgi:hypothetical protein
MKETCQVCKSKKILVTEQEEYYHRSRCLKCGYEWTTHYDDRNNNFVMNFTTKKHTWQ